MIVNVPLEAKAIIVFNKRRDVAISRWWMATRQPSWFTRGNRFSGYPQIDHFKSGSKIVFGRAANFDRPISMGSFLSVFYRSKLPASACCLLSHQKNMLNGLRGSLFLSRTLAPTWVYWLREISSWKHHVTRLIRSPMNA